MFSALKRFLSCPSRLFDPEEGACRFCASLAEHFLNQSDGFAYRGMARLQSCQNIDANVKATSVS